MAAADDVTGLFAHEMATRLRTGEVSSRDLTEAHLVAAERQNHALNAWLSIDRERALGEADAADARIAAARGDGHAALGALHPLIGIPVALKDLISVKGGQATAGSRILEGYRAPYDAHIVERLHDAGAVMLGKTNMDEFAMGSSNEHSAYGPVSNPWDLDTVPGGSSGGSAVAVAAGHAPLAIGTDTGGSIRQPAALCGVVGVKPTYGLVSRFGLVAFASSLDQIGPFAATVADAALLLEVIAGHDPMDSTSIPSGPPSIVDALSRGVSGVRVGVVRELMNGVDADVAARLHEAADALAAAGAKVDEVSVPAAIYGLSAYYLIAPAEASSNLSRYDGVRYGLRTVGATDDITSMYGATRAAGFGAEVKRRIMLGTYALSSGYYDAYYAKAQKVRTLIIRDFDAAYESCDVLLSPTAPTTAFAFGAKADNPLAMYLSDVCTIPSNLAGHPAMSVPFGTGDDGLPVGVQVMAPALQEMVMFRTGAAIEEAANG